MNIKNNIIKEYLRNCYFITGTAYAGKSTMVKALAEKYNLLLFEENYHLDFSDEIITKEEQPSMSYMKELVDWKHFVSRSPEEYEAWVKGVSREVSDIEVLELTSKTRDRKAIVDTNLSPELLREISDYHRVCVMVTDTEISVEKFFDREDPEKTFLLNVINSTENPEETLKNFKEGLRRVNSREVIDSYEKSGFFTIRRKMDQNNKEEVLESIARHFGFE